MNGGKFLYLLGQVVNADYACQDEDGGSGLASCAGPVANGTPIDTGSVGAKSFTVDASDNAGNTASLTHNYSVIIPQEGTENLQSDIQALADDGTLKTSQANGLLKPLDNAIRSLNKGNIADACNQLQDFITEVNAKTPNPLDAATAAELIGQAETIRSSIGC
jgi:hypothetical protein